MTLIEALGGGQTAPSPRGGTLLDFAPVVVGSVGRISTSVVNVVTALASIVLGIWVYLRFVAQQIIRPGIEFTVDGEPGDLGQTASRSSDVLRAYLGSRVCDVWLFWRLHGMSRNQSQIDWL